MPHRAHSRLVIDVAVGLIHERISGRRLAEMLQRVLSRAMGVVSEEATTTQVTALDRVDAICAVSLGENHVTLEWRAPAGAAVYRVV